MKRFLSLQLFLLTAFIAIAQEPPKRAVILFKSEDPASIISAVKAFDKAKMLFTIERVPLKDDTPEMKSALAMASWKNNELAERLVIDSSIEVLETGPEDVEGTIAKVLSEGWQVKTPRAWNKSLRDESRVYGGRKYYVASDGEDTADGLTPASAWRSLSRVNDAALGFADTVCFHSGDIFRGHLEPQSGRMEMPIVYTSYGVGPKPVIEPSYDASTESDWIKVGRKLWKCEKESGNELGNVIFNHGEKGCGWKEDKLEQLGKKDLHFCWVRDEMAVYMVSGRNPAKRFKSIELAEKKHVVDEANCHDVVYDGLWLRYGAAHGIGGSDVKNITIRNCDICWIGGSTLYLDDEGRGVRYGNGIEFWSSAQDILVENCRVWECWDAGLTNQSNVDGVIQKNILWRGNEIWNCEYSYEYWQQGEGARTENIVFENNVCRDAGYGWGHKRRWNPNAAHLMFYDTTAETDGFIVAGNSFKRSKDCGMRLFNAWYGSFTMKDNEWYIPGHLLLRYHARPTRDLINKNPDYLDRTHRDDEAEIQSQTVETPLKIRYNRRGLRLFEEKFGK